MAYMKSHDLARAMQETAEYLLQRPNFDTLRSDAAFYLGRAYGDDEKAIFLDIVRGLGSGKKEWTKTELTFRSSTPMELYACIERDKVCRKVQEEKWECEPLLTDAEVDKASADSVVQFLNDAPERVAAALADQEHAGITDGDDHA